MHCVSFALFGQTVAYQMCSGFNCPLFQNVGVTFNANHYSPLFQRVSCELWHVRIPIAEPHNGTYLASSLNGFVSFTGAATLVSVLRWVAVCGADGSYFIEWQSRGAPHIVIRMYEQDWFTKARL